MNPAWTFEDLIVWQKAHAMVLGVYRVSAKFPAEESFGLTSRVRRAAVSIASNIVEAFNRKGLADKSKFYNDSEVSIEEARYQLPVAHDPSYADTHQFARRSERGSPNFVSLHCHH